MIGNAIVLRRCGLLRCPCCGYFAALLCVPAYERPAGAGAAYTVECMSWSCGLRTKECRTVQGAVNVWQGRRPRIS